MAVRNPPDGLELPGRETGAQVDPGKQRQRHREDGPVRDHLALVGAHHHACIVPSHPAGGRREPYGAAQRVGQRQRNALIPTDHPGRGKGREGGRVRENLGSQPRGREGARDLDPRLERFQDAWLEVEAGQHLGDGRVRTRSGNRSLELARRLRHRLSRRPEPTSRFPDVVAHPRVSDLEPEPITQLALDLVPLEQELRPPLHDRRTERPLDGGRPHPPPDPIPRLEHDHLVARASQHVSASEPRKPCPHDDDAHVPPTHNPEC